MLLTRAKFFFYRIWVNLVRYDALLVRANASVIVAVNGKMLEMRVFWDLASKSGQSLTRPFEITLSFRPFSKKSSRSSASMNVNFCSLYRGFFYIHANRGMRYSQHNHAVRVRKIENTSSLSKRGFCPSSLIISSDFGKSAPYCDIISL